MNAVFERDWMPAPEIGRLETLLRPQFLLENVAPGRLKAELANCHRAAGMMYGGRSLTVADLSGRAGRVALEVLLGTRVQAPEILCGSQPGATELARASVILHGTHVRGGGRRILHGSAG